MSDIFGAPCEKQIGFTLRVGGKGSHIDDRRNWEFYRVAGEVRRIGLTEAKELMTFPDSFQFPVSKSQAMKQLGNSVCVDVVKAVGQSVLAYLEKNIKSINKESEVSVPIKRNKGELSEIYALLKLIVQRTINYGDEQGAATNEYINVLRIQTTSNQLVLADVNISVVGLDGSAQRTIPIVDIATSEELTQLASHIKLGSGTFSHHQLDRATQLLSLEKTKGTSYEKADIQVDFAEQGEVFQQQGMGIKSFLGGLPTLLNASQATNFIYEVKGIGTNLMDSINSIDSSSKIRDRVSAILKAGGCFDFVKCEKEVYESNLRKADTQMPKIIAELLFLFFAGQKTNLLSDIPKRLLSVDITRDELACRLADFVKYSMLGIFPTKPWSGDISANGVFLVKNDAEIIVYHTNKEKALKQFFYQHCVFDTPSSGRHQFGMLYTENNRLFFKLNLQLRLKL
jgi:DNA (cytosine-5)-methyltransferase 1